MSHGAASPTPQIEAKPSDVAKLAENEVGEALRRLREQAKRVRTQQELREIQALRRKLNDRLNRFLEIHMKKLDHHPDVGTVITQLTSLSVEAHGAVQEIRTVRSAIDKGTQVLNRVDQFLGLVGKLAGVLA